MKKIYSHFDVANTCNVKEMLAESSKSAPKAVLYEGIELVERLFDVLSLTDGRKSIPILVLPTNLFCERNAG